MPTLVNFSPVNGVFSLISELSNCLLLELAITTGQVTSGKSGTYFIVASRLLGPVDWIAARLARGRLSSDGRAGRADGSSI